jgi:hypothetical protein
MFGLGELSGALLKWRTYSIPFEGLEIWECEIYLFFRRLKAEVSVGGNLGKCSA